MQEEIDCIIISETEAGQRLDKILADRFKELKSRTYFQYLIEEQKVLVNGEQVKKRFKPEFGDEVEVHFILTPEITLQAENIPLDIIYEDDSIILINKPAGMVVHPAAGNWTGTFVNALLYHCQEIEKLSRSANSTGNLRPGIVHRLDKETTGLLLAAKTEEAQRKLVELFSNRKIIKEYRAICVGKPGDITIDQPIGRHPVQRKMMTVLPHGGKKAISICKTLNYNSELSFVNIVLVTGRTHQIRVHLKHLNTPVLGDIIYGSERANSTFNVNRQMLHAHYLQFEHPTTGKLLEFYAPLPQEMEQILVRGKLSNSQSN
ncbi:MAG: RluA family pseudouridine synthase [Parachlamydiaceae bacterium]|nr:RluA family pseudouridine synthase [Parachlamydiaceae bacterium]